MQTLENDSPTSQHSSAKTWISAALFCLVSLVSFSLWAFDIPILRGASKLYPAIAVVFILGGAPSMLPVFRANNGSVGQLRYLLLFWPAFIVFAGAWWFFWEQFHDHTGEILGSFLGLAGLILFFKLGFRTTRSFFSLLAIAFTWYTMNYYIAEYAHNELKFATFMGAAPLSRMAWGLFFGVGMGVALAFITDSLRPKNTED